MFICKKNLKTHEEKSTETRQKILDSAVEVFFEKGFSVATLNQIAQHAKVTRGAIYWHFKNKFDIFEGLHNDLFHEFAKRVGIIDISSNEDILQKIENNLIDCFNNITHDKTRMKIMTIFNLKCDYTGPEMERILQKQKDAKQAKIKIYENYFSIAQKNGEIKGELLPSLLANQLNCVMSGIMVEFLRGNISNIENDATGLIKTFFNSLKL